MLSGDRRPSIEARAAAWLAGQVAKHCYGVGGCGRATIQPDQADALAAGLQAQGFLLADAATQLTALTLANQALERKNQALAEENADLRRQLTAAATLKTADGRVVGMD